MPYDPSKLQGQKVAIIGGTSGIGFGVASAFASLGCNIVVLSHNEDNVTRVVDALKAEHAAVTIEGVHIDVRSEQSVSEALQSIAPVQHVVYTALEKLLRGPLADMEFESALAYFGVKFWGSVLVGKALAKYDIVAPGGSYTMTSGTAAYKPGPNAVVGCALNGAIISMTRALALELKDKKIRVNTVVPGFVDTELWDKLGADRSVLRETYASALPVGFVGAPGDIAETYVYLARSAYSTGETITIDGGITLS